MKTPESGLPSLLYFLFCFSLEKWVRLVGCLGIMREGEEKMDEVSLGGGHCVSSLLEGVLFSFCFFPENVCGC